MGQLRSITHMHELARERFIADPSKCYQRHIGELYAAQENHERLRSLKGAVVERISNQEAAEIIVQYEWLQTLAVGTRASYGLKIGGELVGVACFATMGGPIRNICGAEFAPKAICLARGACVPHAPHNAASFLVRLACKLAHHDQGWSIFFAYSDADAGEIGTVYQAAGWFFLGEGIGRRPESFHVDWKSPDGGRTITSNVLNCDKGKTFFRSLEWNENLGDPRAFLVHLGWIPIRRPGKKKYVWFEGKECKQLKSLCRYPFLPYPKRRS